MDAYAVLAIIVGLTALVAWTANPLVTIVDRARRNHRTRTDAKWVRRIRAALASTGTCSCGCGSSDIDAEWARMDGAR